MNQLKQFRYIGIAEGISYLFLLGIAMPLKYYMNIPEAVKFTGWIHGVLFIAFIIAAIRVKFGYRFSILWLGWAIISSLIPFGTFILDWQLKKEYGTNQ